MRWFAIGLVVAGCSARELPRLTPEPSGQETSDAAPRVPPSAPPIAPGLRLPSTVTPLAYDVRLELDPDRESFGGHVEIRVRLERATDHIWLHAVDLEIATASFRGVAGGRFVRLDIKNEHGMQAFGFGVTVPAGEITLAFDYTGHTNSRDDEGLFRQQANGRWFLYAQSQAMFARRIVPCFDEPRWKPAWQVTLVVPPKQVALGNGAVISDAALPDGRREVKLAAIAAMPSYLFAVAVGPFALVDAGSVGRNKVRARVAVAPGSEKQIGIVTAKLGGIVDALERYLARPLPLAKLDLVAVPRFFGAMENVGLVTLESSILVGDAKSPAVSRRFIRFMAHELAHQWFGNSVTPLWWDDLWLNEALATWLGEKVSEQLGGFDDAALRAQLSRLDALAADDKPDPRPLRRDITSTDDVDDRFDAISYEKGGAVLVMLERFFGADRFGDAIRGYANRHADRSVTATDFLAAVPFASDSLRWYLESPGAPIVEIELQCKTTPPAIELRARRGTIPVCLRHEKAGASVRVCKMVATRERIQLDACPAWIVGNDNGDGYYRVAVPRVAGTQAMTVTERLSHADDIAAALVRGELPIADTVRELAMLASGDAGSQLAALAIARAIEPLVDDAARPGVVALARGKAREADRQARSVRSEDRRRAGASRSPRSADRAGAVRCGQRCRGAHARRSRARGRLHATAIRARDRRTTRRQAAVRSHRQARDRRARRSPRGVARATRRVRRRAGAAGRGAARRWPVQAGARLARGREVARAPNDTIRDVDRDARSDAEDHRVGRRGRARRDDRGRWLAVRTIRDCGGRDRVRERSATRNYALDRSPQSNGASCVARSWRTSPPRSADRSVSPQQKR